MAVRLEELVKAEQEYDLALAQETALLDTMMDYILDHEDYLWGAEQNFMYQMSTRFSKGQYLISKPQRDWLVDIYVKLGIRFALYGAHEKDSQADRLKASRPDCLERFQRSEERKV